MSYSEQQLINLEQEHDELRKLDVEQLISDGYFEEEWTDYYAETDEDEEDEDGDTTTTTEPPSEAIKTLSLKEEAFTSQLNVPFKQIDVNLYYFAAYSYRNPFSFPYAFGSSNHSRPLRDYPYPIDFHFLLIQING